MAAILASAGTPKETDVAAVQSIGTIDQLRRLGSGGYGTVLDGRQQATGRRVAVKMAARFDPACGTRIRSEFRFLNLLRHPNIVAPGELAHDGERWYFSMQHAGSIALTDFVRGGARRGERPSLDRFAQAVGQIASALAAIHARGFVYCDLKPANMRMDAEGQLRLFDFGSAARCGGLHCMPTHDGDLECTFQYLAPETILNGICGPPADIYALGRICFELLCGHRANIDCHASRGGSYESRLAALLPPDIPAAITDRVVAMMAVDPMLRPTAEALAGFCGANPAEETQRHPRAAKFFAKVRQATAEAAGPTGKGRMMLFVGKPMTCRLIADGSLETCGGDQPVLTIRGGDCAGECYAGAAWGGIADSLARWYHRVPPVLQESIAASLGGPIVSYETPGEAAAERAFAALVHVARSRPTVVVVEQIDKADALSRRLLCRLMKQLPELRLLLVGTARTIEGVKWLESQPGA